MPMVPALLDMTQPASRGLFALVRTWQHSIAWSGSGGLTREAKDRVEGHTMRYSLIAGLTCGALLADVTAVSAQSMMGSPSPSMLGSPSLAVPGSALADAAAAPDAKLKPKQKGPPGAVTVVNASAKTVTGVVLTAGDQTATLLKPLAPKGRTAVKLPKLKGCTVSVAATFDGGSKSGADAFDVCKEKPIRFTD